MIHSFASDRSRHAGASDACNLRLFGAASACVRSLGGLAARLSQLLRRDEPGLAVLRDLGLDHDRPRRREEFGNLHHGLESSRGGSLDTSQGWRGS